VFLQFRDVLDGLANTIAMGEMATDLGDMDTRTKVNTVLDIDMAIAGGVNSCLAAN